MDTAGWLGWLGNMVLGQWRKAWMSCHGGEALWGCCVVVEGIVVGLGRLLQEASGQWLEWVVATAE